MDVNLITGDMLKKLRLGRGESQDVFYRRVGVSSQRGGGYESGRWKRIPGDVKLLVWLKYIAPNDVKITKDDVFKFLIEEIV